MPLVSDAMTQQLVFVTDADNLHTAARLMRKHDIGFLPVCDRERRPIGAVTDRDIVVRACAEDHRPSNVGVRDAMTPEVISCRPLDDLRTAEDLMASYQRSRLLVVSDDGALVGVISLSDIAANEEPARTGETMRDLVSREVH